ERAGVAALLEPKALGIFGSKLPEDNLGKGMAVDVDALNLTLRFHGACHSSYLFGSRGCSSRCSTSTPTSSPWRRQSALRGCHVGANPLRVTWMNVRMLTKRRQSPGCISSRISGKLQRLAYR